MNTLFQLCAALFAAVRTVSAQTGRHIPPTIQHGQSMPEYYACDAGLIPGPRILGGIKVDEASKGFLVMLCPRGISGRIEPKYLIPNAEHAARFCALFVSYMEKNASVTHNPTLWYRAIQQSIRHMETNYPGFTIRGIPGTGALVRSAELAERAASARY
jgi:hypothetical protein